MIPPAASFTAFSIRRLAEPVKIAHKFSRRGLKFDEGFRKTALERLKVCRYITGLAQELGISRSQVFRIQRDALGRKPEPKPEAWLKEKAEERQRRRIAKLERLVARQALELDYRVA